MTRMIKWPSVSQYRDTVKNVQHKSRFNGLDENGEAIINPFAVMPTLRFEGTVKLHGTNASLCFGHDNTVWMQSRENIITPEKDNAGFAMFATANINNFQAIANSVALIREISVEQLKTEDLVIFGEWCGKGIQKGVAISELPKMFVIFGIALVDDEGQKTYLTRSQVEAATVGFNTSHPGQIFSIYNFPTFEMTIDFENPHESQNKLNEITEQVEAECPVGKAMGAKECTTGEGVVWRCIEEGFGDSGFWFKCKGDKHSNSKVKTLATVDVEKINNIKELAEKLMHNGRIEQMIQQVFDILNGGEVDVKRTGEAIKWSMQDCWKEESDTIAASGFTMKELNGPISKIVRDAVAKGMEI